MCRSICTQAAREALGKFGVSMPTLRAYNPDDPIEQAIATLKAYLRKLTPRSPKSFTAVLRDALQQCTLAECAAFPRHAQSIGLQFGTRSSVPARPLSDCGRS